MRARSYYLYILANRIGGTLTSALQMISCDALANTS
jgi:hypothetical protein